MALTSRQVRDVDIGEFVITSNDQKTKKDIVDAITDLYYYESVLQETIRVDVVYADTGKSVEKDGSLKTIVDGLPLVGQEKTSIKLKDANGVEIKTDIYVNRVTPLTQDTTKSLVGLDLVSKEGILNYKVALNTRFDGKISDSVNRILTDQNYLNTKKKLDIEETSNNFNFIGNQRRPFYACVWLAKKAVSKDVQTGTGAGYFFFETSQGFKFRSIDGLLSPTEPGSGNGKQKKKLIFNQTPDSIIPAGYDGKILEHNVNDVGGDIQSKLEIGTYTTRTILFDPFNCYYEVVNPIAKDLEKNLKLAGKKLPDLNPEFNRPGANKDFTRTQYMLIDRGTIPTGDTEQQIQKSEDPNFDPKHILNQSTMRYNQLFNTKTEITIVADFSLHAGDLICIDYPELSNKNTQGLNDNFGGDYVIADLCHYISKTTGGFTKLTLVRDAVGKKGDPWGIYKPL
jgi:phosphopantetheinyl transferase (holo-ACP synthase)